MSVVRRIASVQYILTEGVDVGDAPPSCDGCIANNDSYLCSELRYECLLNTNMIWKLKEENA